MDTQKLYPAFVRFLSGTKEPTLGATVYTYVHTSEITELGYAVVESGSTLVVVRVYPDNEESRALFKSLGHTIIEYDPEKNWTQIVGLVDDKEFKARQKRLERIAQLKAKLDTTFDKVNAARKYDLLASMDPALAILVNEFRELQGVPALPAPDKKD